MKFVVFVLPVLPIVFFWYRIYRKSLNTPFDYPPPPESPFSVSQYLGRMEQAQLDILEDQKPVDQTVILWWGLDGLTLDKNGELKWISRKKPEPVKQNVYYHLCQSVLYADNFPVLSLDMCQSTQARIAALQMQNAALQMQAVQSVQTENIVNQLQNCCAQ